jgi:hypothetical protein
MLRVELPAGIGCRLGANRRDMDQRGGANEKANASDITHASGRSFVDLSSAS